MTQDDQYDEACRMHSEAKEMHREYIESRRWKISNLFTLQNAVIAISLVFAAGSSSALLREKITDNDEAIGSIRQRLSDIEVTHVAAIDKAEARIISRIVAMSFCEPRS